MTSSSAARSRSGYAGLPCCRSPWCSYCAGRQWTAPPRRVVAAGWLVSRRRGARCLQGPYAAAPLAAVTDPALLAVTLDSDYGRYLVVRCCSPPPAPAARRARTCRPGSATPRRWDALALPITWIGTGHTNTAGGPAQMSVSIAHLVAIAAWFGGLALLATCVLPASARLPGTEVGPVVRFSGWRPRP